MNLGELHRREYGRILASLIHAVKDFDLAEDALQEAFAAALTQWPAQGPPQNPVAWLIATARHKAIDQLRRRAPMPSRRRSRPSTHRPRRRARPIGRRSPRCTACS
jgi:RNA polymerase sigma-70 factor, ECF subfamily